MIDDTGSLRVLLAALSQLAYYLPLFAVYVVGIGVAFRHRPGYPTMWRRVILAVVIDLVAVLPGSLLVAWLMVTRQALELDGRSLSLLYGGIGAVRAVIHAAATAVLLSAVFVERERPAPTMTPVAPVAL